MKYATYFNAAIGEVKTSRSNPDPILDSEIKDSILFDVDKNTVVHYTINPNPSFSVKGIDSFHELTFTEVVDMPTGFCAVASVWSHALSELRRRYRGMGWVALKAEHESDLMPILVRRGFVPTIADDGKTQVAVVFLPSIKERLDSSDQVYVDSEEKKLTLTNYGCTIELTRNDCQLDSSNKVFGTNISVDSLGVRSDKLRIYDVSIETGANVSFYYGYATLGRLLKYLLLYLKDDTYPSIGLMVTNRFEAIACLEAGFFPVETKGKGTLYIKAR